MSSPKRLSAKFPFCAISIAIGAMHLGGIKPVLAEHDHGACPDYSEYSDVLKGGMDDLERGPAKSSDSLRAPRSLRGINYADHAGAVIKQFGGITSRQAIDRYSAHKEPSLQSAMDSAANMEASDDLISARRWWSNIADELKIKPQYSDIRGRTLSRLADVELLLSRPDLELLTENESLSSRGVRLRRNKSVYNKRIILELTLPDLDRSSAFKLNQVVSQLFSKPEGSPLVKEATSNAFLRSAMEHYRAALSDEPKSENFIGFALDLVKLAALEERFGEMSSANRHMKDAIRILIKKRDSVDWLDRNELTLDQLPIAFSTERLLKFATENAINRSTIEAGLEHCFASMWVSSAMASYASLGKHDDVVRLYNKFKKQLLEINTLGMSLQAADAPRIAATDIFSVREQATSRVLIADALISVGEPKLALEFCSQWVNRMPIDKIGSAFNAVAIAEVQLSLGVKQEFFASIKKALAFIKQARAENEPAARAKFILCSRIEADLTAEPDKVMQTEASELRQQAAHRIMQLECITLARRLSETGAKLERQGNYDAAGRMHLAASDIKEKNLGQADIETTAQQIDAGRVLTLAGQYKAAADQLKRAVDGVRKMKDPVSDLLRSTMESYADALSKSGREADAERIYDELRRLNEPRRKRDF